MKSIRIKALSLCFLLIFSALALCACHEEPIHPQTHAGIAFDTVYAFDIYGESTFTQEDLSDTLSELTDVFSVANEGATLESFNRSESLSLEIENDHLAACLHDAFFYAALTDGAFDATLGALREAWDISGGGSSLPSAEEINLARKNSGYSLASFDRQSRILSRQRKELRFDLGGIAKGYTVELLAKLYRDSGADGGVLDFGGTVTVFGEKPSARSFTVGIRSPYENAASYAGYVTLTPPENSSLTVSVSGLYERYREVDGTVYTHIFDASSGYPLRADTEDPSDLLSAAVVSENGGMADALSTALLVMGKEKAEAFCERYAESLGFSAILFTADGQTIVCASLDFTPLS